MAVQAPSSRSRFLDLRALAALAHMRFVTRQQIEGAYSGRHRSKQKGGAGEFVDFREYTAGEDLRRLDWKVLARTGKGFIRLFQDETNLLCTMVVDASGSMQFGGRAGDAGSKLQYVQYLATVLTHVISAQQDQIGLAVVSDGLQEVLPPGSKSSHITTLQRAIESLQTRPVTRLAQSLRELFERLSRRGVLVIASDFLVDDLDAVFASIRLFRHRRWEVILLHVIHPEEERLPEGIAYRFEGLEQDGRVDCSPAEIRKSYEERFAAHVAAVRGLALGAGCDYRRVSTAVPYLQTLGGFLVERAGLTLLHSWALFAGLAVALPLVIHWLTRPRPIRMPLSTIRFVREAVQQRRARHRLRDVILLFLRVAAVALLAFAFARPRIGAKPLVPAESAAGTVRVVLLDQSMGMGEVSHGATAFDRARPAAARYLEYSEGARANLILAAAKPHAVVERLTSNFGALRDELSTAQPLPQKLDLASAIGMAADLLSSGSPGQRRELIILSNFQRSNWANVDFSPLPKDTQIQIESVAPAETPANLAVLKVAAVGRVEQGREARLDVEIGNYSQSSREVEVLVTAGRLTTRLKGLCAPGGRTTLSGTIVAPDAGWQGGEARLVGVEDGLAADNARSFVLNVRPSPLYALITRESAAPRQTSSHFLECALAPQIARDPGAGDHLTRVKRISPETLDGDALAGAELIVLDHPGKLSAQQAALLAAALHQGRPVLYVTAEPVDATNLKMLAQSAGADLKLPVEFAPPPDGVIRQDLFLLPIRQTNIPPFSVFGESLAAAMGPLRFGGGLASHPAAGGVADEVLAEYNDHSASLLTTRCGAGVLAILNVDLNESNLISSSVFPMMLEELVDQLAGRHRSDDAVGCGEVLNFDIRAEAGASTGLKIFGPGGAEESGGAIGDDANSVIWHWNAAGPPGVYSIKREAATVFALATAAPAQASDLTPLDPALLKNRLAGDRSVSILSASEETARRDNLWAWVLVVCAGCLLMEVVVLRVFKT